MSGNERGDAMVTLEREAAPGVSGGGARGRGAAHPAPWQPPRSSAVVARCVQVVGAFDAVTAILPSWHHRMASLADLMPTAGMLTARVATAVAGLLLLYLGAGLRRGKRRAWQLATALCALSVVLHVARATLAPAAIAAVLLIVLVVERDRFSARGDLRNRWHALVACTGLLGAGFILGFTEVALRAGQIIGPAGPVQWAQHVALGMVGLSGPLRFQHAITNTTVDLTTGAFGLLGFAVGAVLLLRPGTRRAGWETGDESQVRELLARHGDGDSLGYFALRPDKSFLWAPSRRAAVAYRVVNGVSLASGDPLGIPSAWPDAISAWLADCDTHGWTPAVLACGT